METMLSPEVKDAVKDLRYLLNQGYPRDSSVEFVSDHHQLGLQKRHLLARCVFSEDEAQEHKKRLITKSEAEGKSIGIDGYNVLITVESILEGERIVNCDDGFVRDLQAIFGKYKMSDNTENALTKILQILETINPKEAVFLFDKQVSKSGELAGLVRRKIDKFDFQGNAQTTVGTDAEVWAFEVAASSDRVIIEKSDMVLDLPAIFLIKEGADFVDMSEI